MTNYRAIARNIICFTFYFTKNESYCNIIEEFCPTLTLDEKLKVLDEIQYIHILGDLEV